MESLKRTLLNLDKDTLKHVARYLNMSELQSLCRSNRQINAQLCASAEFWLSLIQHNMISDSREITKLRNTLDANQLKQLYWTAMSMFEKFSNIKQDGQLNVIRTFAEKGYDKLLIKLFLITPQLMAVSVKPALEHDHIDYVLSIIKDVPNAWSQVLEYAAKHNDLNLVEEALKHDVNLEFGLVGAIESGNIDVLDYLLKHDSSYVKEALSYAIKYNSRKIIDYIMKNYSLSEENYCDSVYDATFSDNIELLQFFLPKCPREDIIDSILDSAITMSKKKVIHYLLVDRNVMIPLHHMEQFIGILFYRHDFDELKDLIDNLHRHNQQPLIFENELIMTLLQYLRQDSKQTIPYIQELFKKQPGLQKVVLLQLVSQMAYERRYDIVEQLYEIAD